MPRQTMWLAVRGLGVALLLTLVLVHIAAPRTYVTPGDRLTPSGPARQGREATSAGKLLPDGPRGQGSHAREDAGPMGHHNPAQAAGRFGTD